MDTWQYPGRPAPRHGRRLLLLAGGGAAAAIIALGTAALGAMNSSSGDGLSSGVVAAGPTQASQAPPATRGTTPTPATPGPTQAAGTGAPGDVATPAAPSALPSTDSGVASGGQTSSGTKSTAEGQQAPAPQAPAQQPAAQQPAAQQPAAQQPAKPAPAPPPPAPAPSTSFTFMHTDAAGRPARWNSCKPIRVRVNVSNPATPANARDLVATALAKMSAASGLQFTVLGDTAYIPVIKSGTWDTDTDLIVAWSDEATVPQLAGTSAGNGNITWSDTAAGSKILKGFALVDVAVPGVAADFGSGPSVGSNLLHELGHAVGLGHADDRAQLMYKQMNSSQNGGFAAGDLAGLSQLGSAAGCI